MNGRFVQTMLAVTAALMLLSACAGGISREARSQVTYTGSFESVLEKPEAFQGQAVMWGGKIIEIRNQGEFTEIVALELPLDSRHRPSGSEKSRGRFLARSDQFLDPAIYPAGTLFTVVGRLAGAGNRLIGEMSYAYPVMDIIEIQKVDPNRSSSPRIHIGIGVGTHF
jgi:outer membrane lipoprotein